MVAYADLVLPDTTYLERWDCISLLDRPICDADGAADAIRQPIVEPTATCGRSRRCCSTRRAAQTAGHDGCRRPPKFPAAIPITSSSTMNARPASDRCRAGADPEGESRTRRAEPGAARSYIDNGCHWRHEFPTTSASKFANQSISKFAVGHGFLATSDQMSAALFRTVAEIPSRRAGTAIQFSRRRPDRARVEQAFDPLPFWYAPFEGAGRWRRLPAARDHAAPDDHVSLIGDRRTPGCVRSTRRNRLSLHARARKRRARPEG